MKLIKQGELVSQFSEVGHTPQGWVQISQDQEINSTLDIEVAGCRITVGTTTDPELLKRVCRTLREL